MKTFLWVLYKWSVQVKTLVNYETKELKICFDANNFDSFPMQGSSSLSSNVKLLRLLNFCFVLCEVQPLTSIWSVTISLTTASRQPLNHSVSWSFYSAATSQRICQYFIFVIRVEKRSRRRALTLCFSGQTSEVTAPLTLFKWTAGKKLMR